MTTTTKKAPISGFMVHNAVKHPIYIPDKKADQRAKITAGLIKDDFKNPDYVRLSE